MSFLERTFYGNTLADWGTALAIFAVVLGALWGLERLISWRVRKFAERTETAVDDLIVHALERTKLLFLVLIALWAASLSVALPARLQTVLGRVAVIALLLQGGIWCSAGISFFVRRYRERTLEQDAAAVTTMSAMSFAGKLVLWTVVLLLLLDNLEVDITALVTGLGIGGIAVALAVQNILGDLFASLSIVLDKPFVIGDFLILDSYLGKVEHIGLKTTRLRSLSGEQLVISNGDLLRSRIRNYGRMYERRIVFTIGVTYGTPREKVEEIPGIIREAVEAREHTRFDRSHFKEYGDFALVFETVYFVLKPDYNVYMDIQQAINLEIHRRFQEEGIEFAYPTRVVYWKSLDSGAREEVPASAG